jgi:hypothetical protein
MTPRVVAALLASMTAFAQGPQIGIIDFYGRNAVREADLRKALGVKEGDPLPKSKGDVEERLEGVDKVVRANLEAACCEGGQAILYVGIEERGAPHFEYNSPPAELVKAPQAIHDEYVAFLSAVGLAVRTGNTTEDLSQGHSLMNEVTCRKHQEKFLALAEEHLTEIRKVLRGSADEEQRAIAAYVIGYAPDKKAVIDDLQYALRDPDDTVRNNAMRALGAIGVLAARRPELGLQILPTWFIEALYSLIWSDRFTAANILVTLTERRDELTIRNTRDRAVPALLEMANWKHLPHALPAFILLGRLEGLKEEEIQGMWAKGERQALLGRFKQKR